MANKQLDFKKYTRSRGDSTFPDWNHVVPEIEDAIYANSPIKREGIVEICVERFDWIPKCYDSSESFKSSLTEALRTKGERDWSSSSGTYYVEKGHGDVDVNEVPEGEHHSPITPRPSAPKRKNAEIPDATFTVKSDISDTLRAFLISIGLITAANAALIALIAGGVV